jgi:hypothetical protein
MQRVYIEVVCVVTVCLNPLLVERVGSLTSLSLQHADVYGDILLSCVMGVQGSTLTKGHECELRTVSHAPCTILSSRYSNILGPQYFSKRWPKAKIYYITGMWGTYRRGGQK